jgi:hypothetical protein
VRDIDGWLLQEDALAVLIQVILQIQITLLPPFLGWFNTWLISPIRLASRLMDPATVFERADGMPLPRKNPRNNVGQVFECWEEPIKYFHSAKV